MAALPLPLDNFGQPLLWTARYFGDAEKGYGVEMDEAQWGTVRKRYALAANFDYTALFPGGKAQMLERLRERAPVNDYFFYGGLYDEFHKMKLPRNFWAGVVLAGAQSQETVQTAVQILREVPARRWLWVSGNAVPEDVPPIVKAVGADWIVWSDPLAQGGNPNDVLRRVRVIRVLRASGVVNWFNIHPAQFRGIVPEYMAHEFYRAPTWFAESSG